jgi:formamidopyrimidine-DNA glycosylase
MPELPEVEGIRRRIGPRVVGQRIDALDILDPKLWLPAEGLSATDAAGRTIEALDRHAKLLHWRLSDGLSLVLHLKLAGQVVYTGASGERLVGGHPYPLPDAVLPDRSTRFSLRLSDGAQIFINDQRRFAWLRLLPQPAAEAFIAAQGFGPDPLAPGFTPEVLAERLRRRKDRPIKVALMDQTCLAGLGNIYADEALHAARLHPLTRTGDLTADEVARLHRAIIDVLEVAVPVGGAIVKINRAVSEPETGRDFLRVHGREGEPCLDCAAAPPAGGAAPRVVRIVVGGRGTYLCPVCQPAPAGTARPAAENRPRSDGTA